VRLLGEGIERFQATDYQGALARFFAAYEIVPSAKIYLNIANTLVKLGRESEAADGYERFLAEAENAKDIGDDKKTLARTELARLQARLGRLQVVVKPATATVSLDGKPIALTAKPMYVSPGNHELSITAYGHVPRKEVIEVGPAAIERKEIKLELVPPPERIVARKHALRSARTKKIWGTVLGVVGLGAGGVGVKYLLDSRELADLAAACTPEATCTANQLKDYDRRGTRANTLATVGFAAGGGLVLAGSILFVAGVIQGRPEESQITVSPTQGGAVAAWTTTF